MSYNMSSINHRVFQPSEQLIGRSGPPTVGNYKGDPNLAVNQGTDVPDHLNTSIWITGLPPGITIPQLLDHVTAFKPGRVRSTVINEPTTKQPTSAASISFFRRDDAERLFGVIEGGQMMVGGMIPQVKWNRNRVGEFKQNLSRVLLIAGDPNIVNAYWLEAFFKSKFVYQLDIIIEHDQVPTPNGLVACVEFRFGSWRSQAHSAHQALKDEMKGVVCWEYGLDPCGD